MNVWTELGLDPRAVNFAFLGEAGSGKSELALNLALRLAEERERPVHFFDLDMTKPLFRSRDQAALLTGAGVEVHFEAQFMDAPTLTGGVAQRMRDPGCLTVLDVGGDYIGARSVGGYAPQLNQPGTAVFYVMNPYRPWSSTLEHIDQVLGETLGVSHVALDKLRLVANPNLGPETTERDVLAGLEDLTALVGPYKPLAFLCARADLVPGLTGCALPVFPLTLHLGYPWDA